jgi:NitT/TauT family transport system permease protein
MPSTTKSNKEKLSYKEILLYPLIGVIVVLLLWTIFSITLNKGIKIILNPLETLSGIASEIKKPNFSKAIISTLSKSMLSFLLSFVTALLVSIIASFSLVIKRIVSPIISILRSIPTAAIILILLLCVGSKFLPIAVAILVVLPLSYQNILSGIENVDTKLIDMSKTFGISKPRQIINIYIPSILPTLLSSVIAVFGLNIKVIIAAEVMGLPSVSIGYMILISKQGMEYETAFIWLVIAVLLSIICEIILKIITRLLLPYKYNDLRNIKKFFKKLKGGSND